MIINYSESPIIAISTAANVTVPLCFNAELPAGAVVSKDENGTGVPYEPGEVQTGKANILHPLGVSSVNVYTDNTKDTQLTVSTDYTFSDGVVTLNGDYKALDSIYCEYSYPVSATATLAHTENVVDLSVYADNTKAEELALDEDYTVADGVITLLGDNIARASVYAEYTYGVAPGTPATETVTVTAVTEDAEETLPVAHTYGDPANPAFGILLNDCLAPAGEPREAAVLISGFVYRSQIKGFEPHVEEALNKISFLDDNIATEAK